MSRRQIDRYQVISELGRGGMATVFRARDPHFQRDVAIKVLPREFLHDKTFRSRFEREARTIGSLDHPAIVPVYDFGEEQGQPFLVMRFMEGGSLSERIQQAGAMPVGEVVRILGRIASALDEVHAEGIIHRDLKPGNILFDRRDDSFISDFGIVKLTESTAQLTGSGIVGTPAYMAPEISTPEGLSPLIDVYALGVITFQMLTGQRPYNAPTPMGVLMAHGLQPIPDVRELCPGLPDAVQAVIERGMAKDPMERYQSAGALIDDLAACEGLEAAPAPMGEEETVIEEVIAPAPAAAPEPEPLTPPPSPDAPTMDVADPTPPQARPAALPAAPMPVRERRALPLPWIVGGVVVFAALIVGGLAMAGVFGGGGDDGVTQPTNAPIVEEEPTDVPVVLEEDTPTSAPTDQPTPTAAVSYTPLPTDTTGPTPTSIPANTTTPIPLPTSTSTPLPTDTPLPTEVSSSGGCPPGYMEGGRNQQTLEMTCNGPIIPNIGPGCSSDDNCDTHQACGGTDCTALCQATYGVGGNCVVFHVPAYCNCWDSIVVSYDPEEFP